MRGEARYTRALADEICCRISSGESLRKVCRSDGMLTEATVRNWVRSNTDGFAARYNEARIMCVEAWSEEIIDIAERNDLDPQDKRVRIDTLKWLASKLNPRRFGDRLLIDPESSILHHHTYAGVDAALTKLSPAQLDALEQFTRTTLAARSGETRRSKQRWIDSDLRGESEPAKHRPTCDISQVAVWSNKDRIVEQELAGRQSRLAFGGN